MEYENEVMTFSFFGEETRVVLVDGDPWFVAADVAKILGYGDATHLVRMLDEDEKGLHIVETLGGKQEANIATAWKASSLRRSGASTRRKS